MYFVVDRIEGDYAICEELEKGTQKNILLSDLPAEVKESDILFFEKDSYKLDIEKTEERKALINKKFNSLWD